MESIKCVVVGDEAVGKTYLLKRYTSGTLPVQYMSTKSNKAYTTSLVVNGRTIRLEAWDTAGKKGYDKGRSASYHETNLFIICFSIDCPMTFESVRTKWYPELRRHCPHTPIGLVGTKSDLRSDPGVNNQLRQIDLAPVTSNQGLQMKEAIGAIDYAECSSLTGAGLGRVFEGSIKTVLLLSNIKCVMVGDRAVGKSCVVKCYANEAFPVYYVSTIFKTYTVNASMNDEYVNLKVVDTPGHEGYDELRPKCYSGTDVFLVCFSTICPISFQRVRTKWCPEIRNHCPTTPILLVGTKIDLQQDLEVNQELERIKLHSISQKEAREMMREVQALKYLECSALTGFGLTEVFDEAIAIALRSKKATAAVPRPRLKSANTKIVLGPKFIKGNSSTSATRPSEQAINEPIMDVTNLASVKDAIEEAMADVTNSPSRASVIKAMADVTIPLSRESDKKAGEKAVAYVTTPPRRENVNKAKEDARSDIQTSFWPYFPNGEKEVDLTAL